MKILFLLLTCHLFTYTSGHPRWLFDLPICTGLGDRLGHIISLSALAHLGSNNSTVLMEWCTDAQRAAGTNPLHKAYIPGWTGWEYPLDTLRAHITLPSNVELFPEGTFPNQPYGLVTFGHTAPAIQGISMTSTLYWKALRLAEADWSPNDYLQAYRRAGKELTSIHSTCTDSYVLVHFRCPDHNTHMRDDLSFCTRRVLRRLHEAGVSMKVISNNYTIASRWMRGLPAIQMMQGGSAYTDMQLVLGAAGIVQHASEGWSSYTSVPAMAKGIPLMNTYTGRDHRFDYFMQFGDLPEEFFSCRQIKRFMAAVV